MSKDEPTQSPAMDKLVDEILRGQRVLLLPPGLWAFLLVNFLMLVGGVLVTALVARAFAGAEPRGRIIAHVVSVLVGTALATFAAGCVAVGLPAAVKIVRRTVAISIAIAVLVLVLVLGDTLRGPLVPHVAAIAMLAVAYFITGTEPYFTLALFRQRLRVRRAAMFAAVHQVVDRRA